MDPNLPWRALEEPATGPASTAAANGDGGRSPASRRGLLAAGLAATLVAAAAAAATVAFALAGGVPPPTLQLPPDAHAVGAAGTEGTAASGALPAGNVVVVDVAGAVRRPGVLRLPAGSRVGDAIAAAGGFGPRVDAAAAARLNLAAPLHDGEQVRVPSRDDPTSAPQATATEGVGKAGGTGGAATAGPVDLNRATAAELDALPGIGPATAAKIIASRTGSPFTAANDLLTRKLVSETTFGKLTGLVAVGP